MRQLGISCYSSWMCDCYDVGCQRSVNSTTACWFDLADRLIHLVSPSIFTTAPTTFNGVANYYISHHCYPPATPNVCITPLPFESPLAPIGSIMGLTLLEGIFLCLSVFQG